MPTVTQGLNSIGYIQKAYRWLSFFCQVLDKGAVTSYVNVKGLPLRQNQTQYIPFAKQRCILIISKIVKIHCTLTTV